MSDILILQAPPGTLATEAKQDDIIAALDEQSIPAGAITVGTRDLTAANTWYAVPSTVPTADYRLIVTIENSVGTIRWSPDDVSAPSATYGHRADGTMSIRMKANTSLFFGSDTAGDDVNWSAEIL